MTLVCTGSIGLQKLEKIVHKHFIQKTEKCNNSLSEYSNKMLFSTKQVEYRFSGEKIKSNAILLLT